MEYLKSFKIIGISTKTSNLNGEAARDLSKLWGQFINENVPAKISNKLGDEIYAIYTDYESDYQGKYTCLIGVKVDSLNEIPNGLLGRSFDGGRFQKFIAKGEMPQAVVEKWQEIWSKDATLNRSYTADFEVYGAKSQNGENSEVPIFIALKN